MTDGFTGFGCPNIVDPHHFKVLIPAGRADEVSLVEDFGVHGGTHGAPESVERCRLPRGQWTAVANTVKQAFNERLREKKIAPSRWTVGENRVDRLLGKELCVLAWAVETVAEGLVPNALRNWLGLSPEERWWLFAKAVVETGAAEQVDLGWRKAIRVALTEVGDQAVAPPRQRQRARKVRDESEAPLLEFMRRSGDEH